jgi:hypothetical protein
MFQGTSVATPARWFSVLEIKWVLPRGHNVPPAQAESRANALQSVVVKVLSGRQTLSVWLNMAQAGTSHEKVTVDQC